MDTSKDKIRKRDIVKHGLDKAASKLGLSSHSQAGSSHLFDAIAPSSEGFPYIFFLRSVLIVSLSHQLALSDASCVTGA